MHMYNDCIHNYIIIQYLTCYTSYIQGMAYANNNEMIFMETSAKTDDNVQEVCCCHTCGHLYLKYFY